MRRLKGPQLKMPELKVPTFLVDLFYDLYDRRLLPLVALAIVAIVAVPFLLGGDSEEVGPPPAAGSAGISSAFGSEAAQLTVVEAEPGLRDYRKRLADRRPTNPFKQRYTGPVLKGAKLNPQTKTSTTSTTATSDDTTTTTTKTATGAAPPSGSSKGGGNSGGGDGDEPQLTFFTFVIDVKIVRSGGEGESVKGKSDSWIRRGVKPTTPLPGEKAPVVTYMGANAKKGKALLMVSGNVNSVFGDGKCLSGTDTCQLLEVEPGFPQTFVYGPNDVRYRVNVLQIEPIVTGHS
jgi:hypothetical protein